MEANYLQPPVTKKSESYSSQFQPNGYPFSLPIAKTLVAKVRTLYKTSLLSINSSNNARKTLRQFAKCLMFHAVRPLSQGDVV